jgi:hypothetical protein
MSHFCKRIIIRMLGAGCLAVILSGATSCKKKSPPSPAPAAADAGTAAQFFGLTNGASSSVNLYTMTYARWDPDTPFCKGV